MWLLLLPSSSLPRRLHLVIVRSVLVSLMFRYVFFYLSFLDVEFPGTCSNMVSGFNVSIDDVLTLDFLSVLVVPSLRICLRVVQRVIYSPTVLKRFFYHLNFVTLSCR